VSEEVLGLLDEGEGLESSLLQFGGDNLDEGFDEGDTLFEVFLSLLVHLSFSFSLLDGFLEFGLVHSEGRFEFGEVFSGALEGGFADASGGSGLAEGALGGGDLGLSVGGFVVALTFHLLGDGLVGFLVFFELGHHTSDVFDETFDGFGGVGVLDLE